MPSRRRGRLLVTPTTGSRIVSQNVKRSTSSRRESRECFEQTQPPSGTTRCSRGQSSAPHQRTVRPLRFGPRRQPQGWHYEMLLLSVNASLAMKPLRFGRGDRGQWPPATGGSAAGCLPRQVLQAYSSERNCSLIQNAAVAPIAVFSCARWKSRWQLLQAAVSRAGRRRCGRQARQSQARPRRSRARNSSTRCSSSAARYHFTVELSSPQHTQHIGDIGPPKDTQFDEIVTAEHRAMLRQVVRHATTRSSLDIAARAYTVGMGSGSRRCVISLGCDAEARRASMPRRLRRCNRGGLGASQRQANDVGICPSGAVRAISGHMAIAGAAISQTAAALGLIRAER